MSDYTPPIADMALILRRVVPLESLGRADLDESMVGAILEEAGKLASHVLAPINHSGDKQGARWNDGCVTTADGWVDAYRQYRDGGWNAVPFDTNYGGQGLPWLMSFPVQEMWQAANMSFGLCPLLNQGAVEAILHHGTDEQKNYYLPKLISGEWTGTMNLTEPHAGSDLSLISSKAARAGDGTYKIFGQKIFITYGEHDLAGNIIHLVLARLPDAPEGVKGISLFIVPKILADGQRNDVTCISIEHKLGIHASPTCTMQFGDKGGAVGYLIGKENDGLKYMFTMMNNARLSVGLQGVAIADRALQAAKYYASERKQGKPLAGGNTVAIEQHPDITRMLLTMESLTVAGRILAYQAAFYLDKAKAGDVAAQGLVDVMTPIVKSWCTDNAVEVASLGVQIHGGMGFIEETGAAQFYRDARILPIYEGTNGIQANDLVFRKVLRDGGLNMMQWIKIMREQTQNNMIVQGLDDIEAATQHLLKHAQDLDAIASVAVPYLRLCGGVAGAVMLDRFAKADDSKSHLLHFYTAHMLPLVRANKHIVVSLS